MTQHKRVLQRLVFESAGVAASHSLGWRARAALRPRVFHAQRGLGMRLHEAVHEQEQQHGMYALSCVLGERRRGGRGAGKHVQQRCCGAFAHAQTARQRAGGDQSPLRRACGDGVRQQTPLEAAQRPHSVEARKQRC